MSACSDASAHSVASLALEAYRTRIGAVINFVDDAAAARIPLPTDEGELGKTFDGLLEYLLAAEDAFKESRTLLTEHAGRLERVAAARAALREEQAQTAGLVAELMDLRDAADDEIAAEMNRADELRAAAAAAPVRLTDLIEAAERYAYTTPVDVASGKEGGASGKGPVLPPMPGEAQMRASLTFQLQAAAAAGGRPLDAMPVPDGFPLPVPPELPGADRSHGDPFATRPLPGTAWLEPYAWMRRERAGGPAAAPLPAAAATTTEAAAGAAAAAAGVDVDHDEAMARAAPLASPPPHHLHVPPGPSEGVAAAVATPVPQDIPVTMPAAVTVAAPTPAAAGSGVAGVPSTVAAAAAAGSGGAAAGAAPKRAAAGSGGGINLAALPPEVQALIRSRFPKDWRLGDPLPPNLPPIKQMLASLQRKP